MCDGPARCVKFIARKNWFVVGTDDNCLRVFNYHTAEKVATIDAHADYIRGIDVHPTKPLVATCSDDMSTKVWDWERTWTCVQTFEGHAHYVMAVAFNPKDANLLATASLDGTVKMWNIASTSHSPVFTLKGHEKGVNTLSFYAGADRPYLVTGGDDCTVKIWDTQAKTCVTTLVGHTENVTAACFHPDLPVIVSGGEDGTVRFWHANTFRIESIHNYGFDRVWSVATLRGSNHVAFGFDDGLVCVQLGKEEPPISMDAAGKVIWARHTEILSTNIKATPDAVIGNGERLCFPMKELGRCDVYPQSLQHSPNGRFVVVVGDGEYIVYTALAWRNKAFGKALDFAWSNDGNDFALRTSTSNAISIHRNFEEAAHIRPLAIADGLFGGRLVGVRCGTLLCFYAWDTCTLVRTIDVAATSVIWNDAGTLVTIVAKEGSFILRFDDDAYQQAVSIAASPVNEEGFETAFELVDEITECISSGKWVDDCFIFTTGNRLCYWIGGQVFTIAHYDNQLYFVGYVAKEDRVFLVDKDAEFYSYYLSSGLLAFQNLVLAGELEESRAALVRIPPDQMSRAAVFLESNGNLDFAYEITPDADHRFELALRMDRLDLAKDVAESQSTATGGEVHEEKWKQLGDKALAAFNFQLADECFWRARDFSSLLLLYSAANSSAKLVTLGKAAAAARAHNVAFAAFFVARNFEACVRVLLDAGRASEAALFCRTHSVDAQVCCDAVDAWNAALTSEKHKFAGRILHAAKNEQEPIERLTADAANLMSFVDE